MSPIPILVQSTPATALDTTLNSGFIPASSANLLLASKRAEAPIEIGLDVAAVIEPSESKAGLSDLIFSTFGSLGPSSTSTVLPLNSTGKISLSNFPSLIAFNALVWN